MNGELSEDMSASFAVPFPYDCKEHEKEEIMQINLTPGLVKGRLFCRKCNLSGLQNLQYIGDVFLFLSSVQKKQSILKEETEIILKQFEKVKLAIEQILNRIQNEISNFINSTKSKNKIDESILGKCLNRQKKLPTNELEQYFDQISDNVRVIKIDNQHQIKLKEEFWTQEDQRMLKKIKQEISDLLIYTTKVEQNNSRPQQLFIKDGINIMQFNTSGNLLAIGNQSSNDDSFLEIWKINYSNQTEMVQKLKGHQRKITSISFNQFNDQFITGSDDCTAILWEYVENRWIIGYKFSDHKQSVSCVKFGNSGSLFATASTEVIIWQKQSFLWTNIIKIEAHLSQIKQLCFNPKDNLLLSADENTLIVSEQTGGRWEVRYQLNSSQNIDYLQFLDNQSFFSVSNDIIFWKFSESTGYEGETQIIDNKLLMDNPNLSLLKIRKCVSIYQSQKKLQVRDSIFQFSQDWNRLAISAGGYLQIYFKNV